jgi:hypothetical protein
MEKPEQPSTTHALVRTSPKGGPFRGTCIQCEATDLPAEAAMQPCPNPGGRTQTQSLLTVLGETH